MVLINLYGILLVVLMIRALLSWRIKKIWGLVSLAMLVLIIQRGIILDYFISHPVRIVHTEEIWVRNGVRVNQGKRHKKEAGDIFIRSLDLCLISPSSVIMHRSIFDEFGFFREDLPVCEDYDLWLRITAQEKVGFIEEPLIYKYGGHDDQLSRKFHSMDKYRVLSMIGVLKSSILNDEKRSALIATIQGKCSILINGATKREKFDEVDFYLDLLNEVNGFSGI